ncbi:MAG: hypothetical protein ACPF9X_07025 [Candidatus Poseidoniaceae archaeon]
MSAPPVRPRRRNRSIAPVANRPGSLFTPESTAPATEVPIKNYQGPQENIELQKFAQLILYGISLAAIWGGIISIAWDDTTTDQDFLVLGFGGIISAIMAIALVEWQRRRGGNEVQSIHGYIIGIGFFFSALGVLYSTRLLISLAAESGIDFLVDEARPWAEQDWQPAAEAIYLQLAACILLALGQYWYLRKLKGEITFGLAVNTLTPLAVVMIGFGPWLDWSNQVVSYELGISIISLSALSMWLALRTNNGIIFSIVAVFSGLVPILYEFAHSPEGIVGGEGGALSLMTFIILVQGALAADDRLRQDLMQWTSIFLVGVVIYAIWLVGYEDLNLVLGPLRAENLGSFEGVLNLQVVLWLTVLIAYFPATLKRRIPYMPIGLAGSLFLFTPESSVIPWIIATAMLPYLVIISKVTRRWVADWSVIAISAAFLIQSYQNPIASEYDLFEEVILLAILIIVEYSRRNDRLTDFAINTAVIGLFLSKAVLFGTSWLIPWAVVFYILIVAYLQQDEAVKSGEHGKFVTACLGITVAMVLTVILSALERLEIPMLDDYENVLDGFNVSLAIVALAVYIIMFKFRESELDLGYLFKLTQAKSQSMVPVYDMESQQWINPFDGNSEDIEGYGPLARSSLLGPLALIMISVSFIDIESLLTDVHWIGIIVLPIAILLREVLMEDKNNSISRAIAVWATFIIALPIAIKFLVNDYDTDELQINTLLFDLILLSGPIIVSVLLKRDDMDKAELNESADDLTLFGLLALGLLDASGGLLFLSMYTLVIYRSILHRRVFLLCVAPFAIFLFVDRFVAAGSHIAPLLDITVLGMMMDEVNVLGITIFSSVVLSLSMMAVIIKSVLDSKNIVDDTLSQLPFTIPFIWLTIGLFGMLPDVAWLPTAMIVLITIFAWVSGRLESFPLLVISMFAALAIGFHNDVSDSGPVTDGALWDVISLSAFYGAVYSLIVNQMARTGILYRFINETLMPPVKYDNDISANYLVLHNNETSKGLFLEFSKWATITGFLFSFTVVSGIGPILGALYLTYCTIYDKYRYLFTALPVVHILTFVNFSIQNDYSESTFYQLAGIILIIEGLLLTYYSSKAEYGWKMFDWAEDEEDEFYTWLDNLGIVSMGYVVAGFGLAMQRIEVDELAWGLMAIYLAGVGLQGFRESTEAPWRRGFGTFGTIISLFGLSMEFDADQSIFRYITWMFTGIVAFGFGILYMNRLGEISNLYEFEPQPVASTTVEVEEEVTEEKELELDIDQELDAIDLDSSE